MFQVCHAPRERVSWNWQILPLLLRLRVTLHVSVWVEIWNERRYRGSRGVTLHVSVWVEIYFGTQFSKNGKGHAPRERVSWNIRRAISLRQQFQSHAPRERVSQFSFQRRTYRYWIIQITAWLRSGGIFIPKYYTFFMCFPSNPPIHTPKFVQTNDL